MPRINNPYGELEDLGDSFSVLSADLLRVDSKRESLKDAGSGKISRNNALSRRGQSKADPDLLAPFSSSAPVSDKLSPGQKMNDREPMHLERSDSRSKSPSSNRSRRKTRQVGECNDGSRATTGHATFAQLDLSTAYEKEMVIGWVRNTPSSDANTPPKPPSRPPTHKSTKVKSDRTSRPTNSSQNKGENSPEETNHGSDVSMRRSKSSEKKQRHRRLNKECLNVSSEMEIGWHRNGKNVSSIQRVDCKPASDSSIKPYIPSHLRVYQGKTVASNIKDGGRGNRQQVGSDRKKRSDLNKGASDGGEQPKVSAYPAFSVPERKHTVGTSSQGTRSSQVELPSEEARRTVKKQSLTPKRTDERPAEDVTDDSFESSGIEGGTLPGRGRKITTSDAGNKISVSPFRQEAEVTLS